MLSTSENYCDIKFSLDRKTLISQRNILKGNCISSLSTLTHRNYLRINKKIIATMIVLSSKIAHFIKSYASRSHSRVRLQISPTGITGITGELQVLRGITSTTAESAALRDIAGVDYGEI